MYSCDCQLFETAPISNRPILAGSCTADQAKRHTSPLPGPSRVRRTKMPLFMGPGPTLTAMTSASACAIPPAACSACHGCSTPSRRPLGFLLWLDQYPQGERHTHARHPSDNLVHPHSFHPLLRTPIVRRTNRRVVRHLLAQKHHRHLFRLDDTGVGVRLDLVPRARDRLSEGRHVEALFRGGLC